MALGRYLEHQTFAAEIQKSCFWLKFMPGIWGSTPWRWTHRSADRKTRGLHVVNSFFWTRGKFLFLTRGRFKFWTRGFLFTVCPVRLHNAPIVGDVFALSVDTVQTHIEFRHLKWCTVWKYQRQLFCPIFPGVNLPYNFRTVRWCIWFSSGTFSSCPFPTSRGDCLTKKTRGKTSCKARGQNTW